MALVKYFEMVLHATGHTLPPATMPAPSTGRTISCYQIRGSCGTTPFLRPDTGRCRSVERDNSQAHLQI